MPVRRDWPWPEAFASARIRPTAFRGGDVALVSALAAMIGLVGGLVLVSLAAAGALADLAAQAHLPPWVGLIFAVFGLKVLGVYLLAPRAGWLRRFLPDRKTRLAIVLGSALEWMAAATILYVLLPEVSRGDLLHYLPVFGMAGLLGAVSGLPGGLGAFDAIMIAALGPRVGTADVVGALLLYRLVYVIGPLLIAGGLTVFMGMRAHGRSAAGGRALEAGEAIWREVAPPLFGLLTFVAGVVTLLSVATPGRGRTADPAGAAGPRGTDQPVTSRRQPGRGGAAVSRLRPAGTVAAGLVGNADRPGHRSLRLSAQGAGFPGVSVSGDRRRSAGNEPRGLSPGHRSARDADEPRVHRRGSGCAGGGGLAGTVCLSERRLSG